VLLPWSAETPTLRASAADASDNSVTDQVAFELGDRGENVKQEPA
jgi:hypothetical protein